MTRLERDLSLAIASVRTITTTLVWALIVQKWVQVWGEVGSVATGSLTLTLALTSWLLAWSSKATVGAVDTSRWPVVLVADGWGIVLLWLGWAGELLTTATSTESLLMCLGWADKLLTTTWITTIADLLWLRRVGELLTSSSVAAISLIVLLTSDLLLLPWASVLLLIASNLLLVVIAAVSVFVVLLQASVLLWTSFVSIGMKSWQLVEKTLLWSVDFTKDATLGARGLLLPLGVGITKPNLVQSKGSTAQRGGFMVVGKALSWWKRDHGDCERLGSKAGVFHGGDSRHIKLGSTSIGDAVQKAAVWSALVAARLTFLLLIMRLWLLLSELLSELLCLLLALLFVASGLDVITLILGDDAVDQRAKDVLVDFAEVSHVQDLDQVTCLPVWTPGCGDMILEGSVGVWPLVLR